MRLRLLQDQEAAARGRLDKVTAEGRPEPVDPEELLRRMKAEARLRLAEIERDVADEIRGLDRQLEEAAISFEEFYDRLEEQALRPIEAQRQILERQRGLATTESARTAIDAQLVELEGQRAEVVARFAQERIAAEEEYRDQVLEIEREILEATGRGAEARARKIDERFDAVLARARAEADQEAIAQIERARTLAQTRLRFDVVLEATRRARAELEREIEAADIALEAGTISREEHFERVKTAIEGTSSEVRDMIPELERMAEILGDPELVEVIRQLRLEMERLGLQTKETASEFEEKAFQAGTSALTEFFTTGIRQAKSFGDAMRSLALSVVESIQRIIAQMLAAQIIKGIFSLFGANVPTGFGSGGLVGSQGTDASGLGQGTLGRGVASGGLIRGPGGPRDDEIPAFLSNGEFVIQAEAVNRFGPAFFDRLNRMDPVAAAQPSPTFVQMAGGRSSAPSIQQTGELLNGRLEVGVDEGLILKQLQSNQGQRILLKTISKNRSAIRRALGLG